MGTHSGVRPARLTVGVISAGRVGSALGWALERAGHVVVSCSAISEHSQRLAQQRLPDTTVRLASDVAANVELLLIAVPDDQLPGLVNGLAQTGAVRCGTIVVHTSGAYGITVLAPLADQGCVPLALHPAMTFTGGEEDLLRLADTCFGITAGDDIGYAIAQSLVMEMGGEPFRVREDARMLYHAALAHASNHIVTVLADAVDALRSALVGQELLGQQLISDVPGGLAERIIGLLCRAAVDNTLQRGQAALTGPIARGDAEVVAQHLAVLHEVDPGLARAYCAHALRTAQRAHARQEVYEVLTTWSEQDGVHQ